MGIVISRVPENGRKCLSMSMRIDSVYFPRAAMRIIPFISPELLCALQPGIRSVSTGVANGLKQTWLLSVQSLHAPSSLVCNAAEPDNTSEDELPFDENIPLTGYKEQEED